MAIVYTFLKCQKKMLPNQNQGAKVVNIIQFFSKI